MIAGVIAAEAVPHFDECDPPAFCGMQQPAPSPHVPEHGSTGAFSSMSANSLTSTSSYQGARWIKAL